MKLLAVTSCPVGIAHTYIAAEKLNKMAKKMGIEIKVETQGSTGAENIITEEDIREADGIIIAADKAVSLERFEGLPMIECPIARAIKEPDVLIQMFLDGKVEKKKENKMKSVDEGKKELKSKQPAFYKHLMGGIDGVLMFLVAIAVGSLVTALMVNYLKDMKRKKAEVV